MRLNAMRAQVNDGVHQSEEAVTDHFEDGGSRCRVDSDAVKRDLELASPREWFGVGLNAESRGGGVGQIVEP